MNNAIIKEQQRIQKMNKWSAAAKWIIASAIFTAVLISILTY